MWQERRVWAADSYSILKSCQYSYDLRVFLALIHHTESRKNSLLESTYCQGLKVKVSGSSADLNY
jgi:hypothetical protein